MLSKIKGLIPNWLRKGVLSPLRRYIGGFFTAIGNRILSSRDSLVPPASKNETGYGNFRAIGYKIVILLIKLAGLKPNHKILDIGCGMGRIAAGLLDFVNKDAEYHGLDVVKNNIKWCAEKIPPRNPNFHFQHLDIRNKDYNPHGTIEGTDFKAPLPDGSMDIVILTSVFTHLMPDVTINYFKEISRVLRPGGKMFCTWFLYEDDEQDPTALDQMDKELGFSDNSLPMARYKYRDNPEATIGYELSWVLTEAEKVGLHLHSEVHYGSWAGAKRRRVPLMQDILVLEKT